MKLTFQEAGEQYLEKSPVRSPDGRHRSKKDTVDKQGANDRREGSNERLSQHTQSVVEDYLQRTGLTALIQDYFYELYNQEKLPDNPYPDLIRRFRLAEDAEGLFVSLNDDLTESKNIRNQVATSPELSGVTYIRGTRGVWGLPHVLQAVDTEHLEKMRVVVAANEEMMRASDHDSHGSDYAVNVWVGLTGPAVFAGKYYSSSLGELHLSVNVEVVTRKFERSVDFFAEVILREARRCQGSSCLLLRRIVINCQTGKQRAPDAHNGVWTPEALHQEPDFFISEVKASLPLRPTILMEYLFMPPVGASQAVGNPVVSVQRHYTMHYRSGVKNSVSFTTRPFGALTCGVFFSRDQATGYAEVQRSQGMSFAQEGVAAAREGLALDVERAREIGDTLAIHTSLFPLALLSSVHGDEELAVQATVDVARVTRSAAARHRSLGHLCDCVRSIIAVLGGWAKSPESALKWDDDRDEDAEVAFSEEDSGNDTGRSKSGDDRSRSAMDLFKAWLGAAHRLFWGWRRDVLLYLDADLHSGVMIVKDRVRSWIADVSHPATMGLRLPKLRWHDSRMIVDGKVGFLEAAEAIGKCLASLSGWLHCLDLSLAWDASKICDKVHRLHLNEMFPSGTATESGTRERNTRSKPHGKYTTLSRGGDSLTVPTSIALLQLQRSWLDDTAATASGSGPTESKGRKRRKDKRATAAASRAEDKSPRYKPAPFARDSTSAPPGVDIRLAVVEILREDVVPESLAHEITLLRYAVDNRIDESLRDVITSLVASALVPKPYPILTDTLAPISSQQLLCRLGDSDTVVRLPPLFPWRKAGDRVLEAERHEVVFVAKGTHRSRLIFGLRPALEGVDVDAVFVIFSSLPPIHRWVQDEVGREIRVGGGGCTVEIAVDRSQRLPGLYTHNAAPSELTVTVPCTFEYDVSTGVGPRENFAHLAVHCALVVHQTPQLVLIDLRFDARSGAASTEANKLFEDSTNATGVLSLDEILHDRGEVFRELVRAAPSQIMLRTLKQHPIPGRVGQFVWVELTLHFVLVSDDTPSSERDEAVAANLLYDCIYSTGKSAKSVGTRYLALLASGLPDRHAQRLSLAVLAHVNKMNYLEAYRFLLRLRRLRPYTSDAAAGSTSTPPKNGTVGANQQRENVAQAASTPNKAHHASDVAVDAAIVRMLRGPAGRLDHVVCMLKVLKTTLSGTGLPPESVHQIKQSTPTVKCHAEYTVRYLLDSLAEQPPVRFEGAVEALKLRARLLLDCVRRLSGAAEGLKGDNDSSADGSEWAEAGDIPAIQQANDDSRRERACELLDNILSLLDIVQLAVGVDVHRCCPDVGQIFDQLRLDFQQRVVRLQRSDARQTRVGNSDKSASTKRTPSHQQSDAADAGVKTASTGGGRRNARAAIPPTQLLLPPSADGDNGKSGAKDRDGTGDTVVQRGRHRSKSTAKDSKKHN